MSNLPSNSIAFTLLHWLLSFLKHGNSRNRRNINKISHKYWDSETIFSVLLCLERKKLGEKQVLNFEH